MLADSDVAPPRDERGPHDPGTSRRASVRPSRVLLVGFMASGKTTVGEELARALGWTFADVDRIIESKTGRSIAAIFREEGEAAFRELEAVETDELLTRDRIVIATGGGWAAVPGRLRGVPGGTLTAWLRVSAELAVARARRQGVNRPLLEGARAVEEARRLLDAREPCYREADLTIEAGARTVAEIATELLGRVTASNPPTNRTK